MPIPRPEELPAIRLQHWTEVIVNALRDGLPGKERFETVLPTPELASSLADEFEAAGYVVRLEGTCRLTVIPPGSLHAKGGPSASEAPREDAAAEDVDAVINGAMRSLERRWRGRTITDLTVAEAFTADAQSVLIILDTSPLGRRMGSVIRAHRRVQALFASLHLEGFSAILDVGPGAEMPWRFRLREVLSWSGSNPAP